MALLGLEGTVCLFVCLCVEGGGGGLGACVCVCGRVSCMLLGKDVLYVIV